MVFEELAQLPLEAEPIEVPEAEPVEALEAEPVEVPKTDALDRLGQRNMLFFLPQITLAGLKQAGRIIGISKSSLRLLQPLTDAG